MPEINPVFRKTSRLGLIALLGFFLFFLVLTSIDFYKLLSGSYFINNKDLFRLDTLQLQGRAYRFAGGGKSGTSRIEFTSSKGQNLKISGERFWAVSDLKELIDTLMYYGLKFIVYVDKDGLKEYLSRSQKTIYVYQIIIGRKSYIDTEKANELSKSNLTKRHFYGLPYIFLVLSEFTEI